MVANPLTARIDAGRDIYGIKLDIFEGPLDLLLFLIRKSEIDVYDIPIAKIAKQYLEYVDIIHQLNLEQAGDFLVMAATLMKIKSRMLLPAEAGDGEEGEEDPRDELVRRLLEYQQTKEVATWMEDRQERFRDVFYRGAAIDREDLEDTPDESMGAWREVGLFDLISAFNVVMTAASEVRVHQVEAIEVTTEERVQVILAVLERRGRASFTDLISGLPRITLVVTFVALLEMVKEGRLVARQSDSGGDIWLYPATGDEPPAVAESPDEDKAPTEELKGEEARLMAEALGISRRRPPPWMKNKENGTSDGAADVGDGDGNGAADIGDDPKTTEVFRAAGDEPHSVGSLVSIQAGDEPNMVRRVTPTAVTPSAEPQSKEPHPVAAEIPESVSVSPSAPLENAPETLVLGAIAFRAMGDEPNNLTPRPRRVTGDEPHVATGRV